MGVSLLIVLAIARIAMLWDRSIAWQSWTVVGYFWQDAIVGALFIGAGALTAHWRFGFVATRALFGVTVAYTALNVPIVRHLSTPLTAPMLSAARGALADSILTYLTWPNVVLVLAIVAAGVLLPFAVVASGRRGRRNERGLTPDGYGVVAALLVAVTGLVAAARIDTAGLHRNPLVTLGTSALPRVAARVRAEDWTASPFEPAESDDLSHLRGTAAGRNVVIVGLESTAAQYLRLYGGRDDLTPRLDELARHAVVFDRAYAVTPESIKGLFSVLCSRYPAFDAPSHAYGTTECWSIASTLGAAGYRTAMFHSGRFGYLGMEPVVRDRGFDVLEDAGHIGGNRESSFGVDEPATVDRMLRWIDGLPDDAPFLLTYLPIAGHHPYATPARGPFSDDSDEGRYRNAIRYGDESLGTLIDGIRDRGLADRTVWIVYGDHGQAFGQHEGNYGHTFFLYEENVRVPFLVAAPGAIDQTTRSRTIVSLVDIAPTVLDLLGMPIPDAYQGRSALDDRPQMALFFTQYSLSLVGLRDGRWKLVHDLASGQSRLFDLERDPAEATDLSSHHRGRVAAYEARLTAWAEAQKALVEQTATR